MQAGRHSRGRSAGRNLAEKALFGCPAVTRGALPSRPGSQAVQSESEQICAAHIKGLVVPLVSQFAKRHPGIYDKLALLTIRMCFTFFLVFSKRTKAYTPLQPPSHSLPFLVFFIS